MNEILMQSPNDGKNFLTIRVRHVYPGYSHLLYDAEFVASHVKNSQPRKTADFLQGTVGQVIK